MPTSHSSKPHAVLRGSQPAENTRWRVLGRAQMGHAVYCPVHVRPPEEHDRPRASGRPEYVLPLASWLAPPVASARVVDGASARSPTTSDPRAHLSLRLGGYRRLGCDGAEFRSVRAIAVSVPNGTSPTRAGRGLCAHTRTARRVAHDERDLAAIRTAGLWLAIRPDALAFDSCAARFRALPGHTILEEKCAIYDRRGMQRNISPLSAANQTTVSAWSAAGAPNN
jgi:hypothetical protein